MANHLPLVRLTPAIAPTLVNRIVAILLAGLAMTISSRLEVPMVPVPMTMQTFTAIALGGLLGARMGALAVTVWLFQGIAGFPVFSGGGSGLGHFVGPTGGYLVAFVAMAYLAGLYADRRAAPSALGAFTVAMGCHAVCLGFGTAWLATQIGFARAVDLGLAPFVVGSVVKSALVAAAFVGGTRYLALFGRPQ